MMLDFFFSVSFLSGINNTNISHFQFSSVSQSCLTLFNDVEFDHLFEILLASFLLYSYFAPFLFHRYFYGKIFGDSIKILFLDPLSPIGF